MAISSLDALPIFAVTASFLALQMVVLDAYSGVVRGKSKTTPNVEDAGTVQKGAQVLPADPDAVARVLRAHRNLIANGIPFLILSFIWVILGASKTMALAVFGAFIVARVAHSIAYVAAKQPWRTLSFVLGQAALVTVLVMVVRGAISAL